MDDRFRDYDVLAKRQTPSWNDQTNAVIDARQTIAVPEGVLDEIQLATLRMLIDRICPDPAGREPTTTLAMVMRKIADDVCDGYRHHRLPPTAQCWRRGLAAIDAEARAHHAVSFCQLAPASADAVLEAISRGDVRATEWEDMPRRSVLDLAPDPRPRVLALGAAVPVERDGFRRTPPAPVAMSVSMRTVAIRGKRSNTATDRVSAGPAVMAADAQLAPRAIAGRAPDVFTPGGWVPMRDYGEDEVDFVIVGTGAGGGDARLQTGGSRFLGNRDGTLAPTGGRSRILHRTNPSNPSSIGPTNASSMATIR